MSESKETSKSSATSNRVSMAIIGLIVVFLIALLVNYVVGIFGGHADLTENKVFTLSDGTLSILERLETPVEIRYYVTDDSKVMSPSERAYARRVEDLLNQYVRKAPTQEIEIANEAGEFESRKVKMLTVKKLNPEPNTDAEDAAIMDGLQAGISRETNNELFFGMAVSCIESRETIPFIPAKEETVLEYDLSRAISNVHGGKEKKVVVISSMKVAGGMTPGNFQAPPKPAWIFYEQLGRDYQVSDLPTTTTEIPDDTSTLVLLHPYDITEEAQFAIDQYLLKGGNLIVFVDPNFFYNRALQPQGGMPGMPPPQPGPAPSSNLETLFKAWGVTFDSNQVLADLDFGTEILRRGNFSPTFLTLDDKALDPNDQMTKMLEHLNMLTPGAFKVVQTEGIKVEPLVQSSEMNQLVGSFDADPTQEGGADRIRQNFKSSGERQSLVVRLSGNFKTAFPEGDPSQVKAEPAAEDEEGEKEEGEEKEKEDEEKKEEATAESDDSLKESASPGRVLLFADVDFIYDETCVRRASIPGLNIQIPQALNENLTLVQNAVEIMSGDPDLVNVRSRSSVRRPFTRQNEWYREAQAKYRQELLNFQEKAKDAETRLNEIIQATPENIDEALMSTEVQDELKKLRAEEVEFSRKERELQKEMTREFRRKQAVFKFGNALGMPIIVILFGIVLAVLRRSRIAAR